MSSNDFQPLSTFEELCLKFLEVAEYDVVARRDERFASEVDIVARSRQLTPQGTIEFEWLVDCVQGAVSLDKVRQIAALASRRHRPGLIITAAALTRAAAEFVEGSKKYTPIVVWDYPVLSRMVKQRPWLGAQLSWFAHGSAVSSEVAHGASLMERLRKCQPGKRDWKAYENLMVDVLQFLFVPPLGAPRLQSRTIDRLDVRDALLPNKAESGFWLQMRQNWGCHFALFEFKNLRDGVGADEVDQVRLYTQRKSIGRLAFVVGRQAARKSARDAIKVAYQYSDLMVVLLDDFHIESMLRLKGAGDNPTIILDEIIDDSLLAY